jgi:sugar phosphate isomerase/epimerase
MEAAPPDLVSIAHEVGCDAVCIFVRSPPKPGAAPDDEESFLFPTVTQKTKRAMIERLRDLPVTVTNVEYFPIGPDLVLADYRAPFELAAELGARLAVTHIHDTEDERAVESFGKLCDLAAEYDLAIGLEFMGLSAGCNSLARAVHFIDGAARKNAGIAVDALHLVRTGGTPADVAALPARYFVYSQMCDGRGLDLSSDYLPEALDRLLPGEGDFPLHALIEALPLATALDVEVPSPRRAEAGVPALQRTREAVAATRLLLDRATVTR